MARRPTKVTLRRKQDQVLATPADSTEEIPVKILWARPVSGRGKEVSFITMDNREVALIDSLDELDRRSRRIAEEELARRYLVPKIEKVVRTDANFGNRYWVVDTDHGRREFVMRNPNVSVTWITDDKAIIRDTLGNRYEIESYSSLDPESLAWIAKIL